MAKYKFNIAEVFVTISRLI